MTDNQLQTQKSVESGNTRDIFFLLNKYQEYHNGVETSDICVLFSFWQSHFGPSPHLETNSDEPDARNHLDENKTWMNYNSKSFNNKTFFGNEQTINNREYSIEDGMPQHHSNIEYDKKYQLKIGDNHFSVDINNKKLSFADKKIEEVHSPIHNEEKAVNIDEQFSFDKDFNFNPDENKDDQKPIETTDLHSQDMSEIIDMDEKDLVNDLKQIDHRFDLKDQIINPLQLHRVGNFQSQDQKFEKSQFKFGCLYPRNNGVISQSQLNYHQIQNSYKFWLNSIVKKYQSTFMVLNSTRCLTYIINCNYIQGLYENRDQNKRRSQKDKLFNQPESPQKLSELIQMSDISPIAEKKHKIHDENEDFKDHTTKRRSQGRTSSIRKQKNKLSICYLTKLVFSNSSLMKNIKQVMKYILCINRYTQFGQNCIIYSIFQTIHFHNFQIFMWNQSGKDNYLFDSIQAHLVLLVQRLRSRKQLKSQNKGIEHLSSISIDKFEENEVKDVLKTFNQPSQVRTNLKRNDDLEYKQREIRNLSKFRDKSQVSNKSEFGLLKIDQLNDILSQKSRDYQKSKEKEKKKPKRKERSKHQKTQAKKRHRGKSLKDPGASSGGHKSQLSKSKSRFSNHIGFNNLQNMLNNELEALENTQDIEKLLNEIDNDQFELEQFITKEEEDFQKKVENKLDQGEQEIQTRRDGSNQRGPDSFRHHNYYASKEYGYTQRIVLPTENYNQHHNNISNNSGSFYFNMSKKLNVQDNNKRGEDRKKSTSQNPYSNNLEPNLGKQSSSEESCSSQSSEHSQAENKMKLQHALFSKSTNLNQQSELLTERANLDNRLEYGRSKNKIVQEHRIALNIGIEKSNERGISVVSANSIGVGMAGDSRYMLNNLSAINMSNNQNTYHSLSRVGIKKISSGYSNQSPQNAQNFISNQRLLMGNQARMQQNINLQNTQKSYKSLNPANAQQTIKNPVLLRLQTNQQNRVQSSHNSLNMHTIGPHDNSQGGAVGDLSHRHGGTTVQNALGISLNSIITPKSFKATGQMNFGGKKTNEKQQNGKDISSFIEVKDEEIEEVKNREHSKSIVQPGLKTDQGSNRKQKKIVHPVLKKIDLQQALKEKSSKEKSQESLDGEQIDSQNVSQYAKDKYSLNSSANLLMKFKQTKEKSGLMNQSITKLSEKVRNNSSTSSIGGTSRGKLKLKFKQSNLTNKHSNQVTISNKSSMIEKNNPDGQQNQIYLANKKVNATAQSSEIRRDRNSRVGARYVQGSSKMQTNVIQVKVQTSPEYKERTQYTNESESKDPSTQKQTKISKLKQPSLNSSAVNKFQKVEFQGDQRIIKQSIHSQYSNQPQQVQQQLSQSARTHTDHQPINVKQGGLNLKGQASKQQTFGLYPFNKSQNANQQKNKGVKQNNFVSEYSDSQEKNQPPQSSENNKFERSRLSAQVYQDNKEQDQHQQMIQQSYYAAAAQTERNPTNPGDNLLLQQHASNMNRSHIKQEHDSTLQFNEHEDPVRLVELLISELRRKKGKNIQTDYEKSEQLNILISFWRDSLTRNRILHKLKIKQNQGYQNQKPNQTNTSNINYRLSEKEIFLLNYLEGTDKTPLLQLGKESTTRNYGELATIPEYLLAEHICLHLGLDLYDGQVNDLSYQGDQKSYHMPQPSI